jgi:WD40 repeat protein
MRCKLWLWRTKDQRSLIRARASEAALAFQGIPDVFRHARIFISYSRHDEPIARFLRERLTEAGFSLWQDRSNMEGGKDWWDQIDEALHYVSYMVLVITSAAVASPTVQKEWRLARQRGVCVIPVYWAALPDFSSLPRWIRETHMVDAANSEQWTLLLHVLERPCAVPRVPFMADDLPPDFVPRPAEFEHLISSLLDERKEQPVSITAALRGAGGYGKTTLAVALCHDLRIQEEFHDGVLWVTLGREPGDVTSKVADLIETLTGERPGLKDAEAAASKLAEALADRDLLLVVDDVWRAADARPFLRGGSRCVRLLTTRNAETVPSNSRNVRVDAMRQTEALRLLTSGLPITDTSLKQELLALAARVGEWPLLLKLVNGALRRRVNDAAQPLADALRYVKAVLDRRGLTAFDGGAAEDRNLAASKTLGLSLELLHPAERAQFAKLAIFPEDADIPLTVLEKLWRATHDLDEIGVEDLCVRLFDLSLVAALDLSRKVLRVHDVLRSILRTEAGVQLRTWNNQLLDAYGFKKWWAIPAIERYLWQHVAWHFVEAGRMQELEGLLFDFRWLQAKLDATDVNSLLADCDYLARHPAAGLLHGALRLSAHVLVKEKNQLAAQMTGRLLGCQSEHINQMLASAAASAPRPWLKPLSSSLTRPGGPLVRTLEGHTDWVMAIAVAAEGQRVISGSNDWTLRVWNLSNGSLLQTLNLHSGGARSVAVTPDGERVVFASCFGCTPSVWDLHGTSIRTLIGHSGEVMAVAVTPDGQCAVSASEDRTVRTWNLASGALLRTLEGHSGRVIGVAVTGDGRYVLSASDDGTFKLWDFSSGKLLRTFQNPQGKLTAIAVTPSSRGAISGSSDGSLYVWDLLQGATVRTLKGHGAAITGLAVMPDGRHAVSSSADHTLKVWDLTSGADVQTLEGHTDKVLAVAVTLDGGRVVSGSGDGTLKVWHLSDVCPVPASERRLTNAKAVAITPDGKWAILSTWDRRLEALDLASNWSIRCLDGPDAQIMAVLVTTGGSRGLSASAGGSLKLWDVVSGALVRTLKGYTSSITTVAATPDGARAISAFADGTLELWDLESGKSVRTIRAHMGSVAAVAVAPDGQRAVSASGITLRFWNLVSGRRLRSLKTRTSQITSLAVTGDGQRAISGMADGTLHVWNLVTATPIRTIGAHVGLVSAVAVTYDGRRAISVSEDRSVKIWNLDIAECLATFAADAPVLACAISENARLILASDAVGCLHLLKLVE